MRLLQDGTREEYETVNWPSTGMFDDRNKKLDEYDMPKIVVCTEFVEPNENRTQFEREIETDWMKSEVDKPE